MSKTRYMRIAVLSDVHGNRAALEAVLADIDRRGVDRIVNLGDCFSGPLDVKGTAELLMSLDIATVRGNHDRLLYETTCKGFGPWEEWALRQLDAGALKWVRNLPAVLDEGELLFCHATPQSDTENWLDHRGPQHRLVARDLDGIRQRLGPTQAQVILCGHTHTPRVVRIPGGPIIVNPGSVGVPAYLDTRMTPNFVHQTGAPDARYSILENVDGDWRADLIHVPYDIREMLNLAQQENAVNWVAALSSGWVA